MKNAMSVVVLGTVVPAVHVNNANTINIEIELVFKSRSLIF